MFRVAWDGNFGLAWMGGSPGALWSALGFMMYYIAVTLAELQYVLICITVSSGNSSDSGKG